MPLITNPQKELNSSNDYKIFIFKDKDILLQKDYSLPEKSFAESLKKDQQKDFFLDTCTGAFAIELDNNIQLPENLDFIPIRQYFAVSPAETGMLAARLKAYINWREQTRFCSKCGSPLQDYRIENALICPKCQKIHYPRIEPCIIVLVRKGEEILLARHKQRNQNLWTCIAGFIEAGESVENAVYREVKEEVNLEIENLEYAGSQGWPYPDQLMLAFYADYKGGEIKPQEEEIAEARWFKKDLLPELPKAGSVAYKLIHRQFNI